MEKSHITLSNLPIYKETGEKWHPALSLMKGYPVDDGAGGEKYEYRVPDEFASALVIANSLESVAEAIKELAEALKKGSS